MWKEGRKIELSSMLKIEGRKDIIFCAERGVDCWYNEGDASKILYFLRCGDTTQPVLEF